MIKRYFRRIWFEYKSCFTSKHFLISASVAIFMLVTGFIISSYAVQYATESASSSVTDLILSNVPVVDLDGMFVNGAIIMVFFIILVCLWQPKRIPFTVKTISTFMIVRSLFIILTHIGAFPTHAVIHPSSQNLIESVIGVNLYSSSFLGNDSFFSGHTGLPFLMAFIYYDRKWLRVIFIALSIIFGVVVLLAHLHYTIDVLSAFFISYGIYRMSRLLYSKDFQGDFLK
jgi:hypothetical protein